MDSLQVNGVKSLVLHNNWLLVGKWFGASSGEYFSVYQKSNFSHVYTEKSISGYVSDMVVVKDTAYVLYNVTGVSSNDTAKVAIISLTGTAPSLVKTQLIGTYNLGLDRIIASGNMLHLFSTAYSSPAVAIQWDVQANNRNTYTLASAGTPVRVEDSVVFGGFGQGFSRLVPSTGFKQLLLNRSIYKGMYDTLNSRFYLIHTDFVSPDWVYVANRSGSLQDSFQVGMSTEAIAFDYRGTSGIADDEKSAEQHLDVYPNPASDFIRIAGGQAAKVSIFNAAGQAVYISSVPQNEISLTQLPVGFYTMKADVKGRVLRGKFIRK
jgi:hypothetical protein